MYRKNQFRVLLAMIIVFTFPLVLGTPLTSSGFPSVFNAQMLAAGSTSNDGPGENMNQQLIEKAKRQGRLRVIVTRLPPNPPPLTCRRYDPGISTR